MILSFPNSLKDSNSEQLSIIPQIPASVTKFLTQELKKINSNEFEDLHFCQYIHRNINNIGNVKVLTIFC